MTEDLDSRKDLARQLLAAGIEPNDLLLKVEPRARAVASARLDVDYPPGLEPKPAPIDPEPEPGASLPKVDVVVITWTVDEQRALSDVLTPGFSRDDWYRYNRKFKTYDPKIRDSAPAKRARRLGSYFLTRINGKRVLCFKSELHLNQDGIERPPAGSPGNATLPVKDLFGQLLDETKAGLVITTGTAGATFKEHDLGDVVVTRGAKFRLQREFRNTPFAKAEFRSDWKVPTGMFERAVQLMQKYAPNVADPPFHPPTVNFAPLTNLPKPTRPNTPDIKLDGRDMAEFHPILTTDYFEFGTSTNKLWEEGCGVEMGDAVLGLVVEERRAAGKAVPNWLVIRNCSDPQINGALRDRPASQSLQAMWAVYYYLGFGYWTSVMSALSTWAVIADLP